MSFFAELYDRFFQELIRTQKNINIVLNILF